MSTAAINYDALAQQHGGSAAIDYDALAAQHGGSGQAATQTSQDQPDIAHQPWSLKGLAQTLTTKEGLHALISPLEGVGQGALQTVHGTGELIRQGGNLLHPGLGDAIVPPVGQKALQQVATPENAGQSIGAGLEGMGEFMTGDEALKGLSAADKLIHAGYLAKALQASPKLQTALRIGMDAMQSGVVGGAQGVLKGQSASDATKTAGITAGVTGAVEGLAPVANYLLRRGLLLGKTPEAAYESAMKPSTTMPPAQRAAIVNTALQEKIPVSKGGLQKLNDLVDDLNTKVQAVIDSDPNRPINKFAVASRLGGTAQRFATQVNPEADLEAVSNSGNEFLRNQPGEIPASQAQALKQGTYQQLGDKAYGELQTASKESQKALARGLKEEIANQFPEISQLNARESKLFDLQDVLERAVGRISNHQIMGIGTPIVAGAGKAVTGSAKIGAGLGVFKAVLDDPNVKSRLAIALSHAGVPSDVAFSRVASLSAALASSARTSADQTTQ